MSSKETPKSGLVICIQLFTLLFDLKSILSSIQNYMKYTIYTLPDILCTCAKQIVRGKVEQKAGVI